MKTKVLNFVMPVFVFIMAIGLAFATEKADEVKGYYFNPDTGTVESVMIDCDSTSPDNCEFREQQVYAEKELINELQKTEGTEK